MTPANDPFGVAPVRRSAAFPCAIARGALPPGGPNRLAPARAGWLSVFLTAVALLLPQGPAQAAAHPAARTAAASRLAPRPALRPVVHRATHPVVQPAMLRAVSGRVIRTAAAATRPGVVASPRAGRHAAALHPRRARPARPTSAAPVMADAPQELLPAAESMDLARRTLPASPRGSCLAAARHAEQVHGLPPGLLVAVAMSESGLHAHAINLGGRSYLPRDLERAREILAHAPRRASPMVGCVQVNARVHARGSDWPLDPLRSTDWAGGMLRRWHQETGDWVEALRRWHGGSARTAHAVLCRVRAKLEVANPANAMLRDYACSETEVARVRRAGQDLLEVAEYAETERAAR